MTAPSPTRPQSIPDADRTPAIITHLSPLLGYVLPTFGHLLGPLLAWLAYRNTSRVLDRQGKEALNFQLSLTLYGTLLTGVMGLLFGLGLLGGLLSAVVGTGATAQSGNAAPMFAGLLGTVLGFFGPFVLLVPLTLLLSLFPLIVMLIAASRASRGESYHYPLTIRFLR